MGALFPFTANVSVKADQLSTIQGPAIMPVSVASHTSPVWVTAPSEPMPVVEDERVITIHLGPDGQPAAQVMLASNNPTHDERVAQALANRRQSLVNRALTYRGTPYVWGGTSTRGFDCSGFTQYLFRQQGKSIPRTAKQQFGAGTPVSRANLRQGDLVFFNTTGPITHVGMYIGNGKFVHAANPRRGVRVDNMSNSYYSSRYAGARRY